LFKGARAKIFEDLGIARSASYQGRDLKRSDWVVVTQFHHPIDRPPIWIVFADADFGDGFRPPYCSAPLVCSMMRSTFRMRYSTLLYCCSGPGSGRWCATRSRRWC